MASAITNLVLKEGGCFRCALRLSGEISMNLYQTTENQCSCPFCLGILSPSKYLELVLKTVQECKYEFVDYKFQVMLPSLVYLRHEWLLGKFKLSGVQIGRVVDIKDAFKWVFSPVFGESLKKPFNVESDFKINLNFDVEDQSEVQLFYQDFGASKKESNLTVFKSINCERITSMFPVLPVQEAKLLVSLSHSPIYITGSYLKFSRNISQTPWSADSESEVIDSVQDSISRVVSPHFDSTNCILHSSGREDIDVRMLGTGRPFIMEIEEPKKAISGFLCFSELENAINLSEHVKVRNLEKTNKGKFEEIRMGEEHKLKVYACIVWSELKITEEMIRKIDDLQNLLVFQKTPIRVMHRRSLMTREKSVLRVKARKINEHYMEVRLITSGGTYVKEFIHGDFKRTSPSLSEIVGGRTDILQLDVLGLGWSVEEIVNLLTDDVE